jgi:PERQ amino acid-rich with GYF domain-containing protein
LKEIVPTKQEEQPPVVSSQSGKGISETKQEIVEDRPAAAVTDKKKASSVPVTGENLAKSATAADKPKQAAVAQPKPAEPTANSQPAELKQGKISTTTQEAFQKQKKGETASTAKAEIPFSSLVNDLSSAASPSASAPKAAPWAKGNEEEGKAITTPTLTPSSSMSLREIQAKEQKEAEIRKTAEKRATAARIAAEEAATAERLAREAAESLPATSKWGDVASPAATSTPATSPWAKPAAPVATATTRSGTVKRTLKEIQEEEARQKKEAAAQAQARAKAYASSVGASNGVSTPASTAVNAGGAWTTVGSGTKPPVAVAPAVKPAPTAVKTVSAAPAPSMASRLAGN